MVFTRSCYYLSLTINFKKHAPQLPLENKSKEEAKMKNFEKMKWILKV